LAKFNEKYAVVRLGNSLRILEEHRDSCGRVERVSFLKQADFGLAVKNWPISSRKHANPARWWLGQPDRRDYGSVVFSPGGGNDGEYNLWQGFPIVGRAGDCHLFWTVVEEVICAGDAEQYRYLRRYMAHTIQRPAERPEVAFVLRGAWTVWTAGHSPMVTTVEVLGTQHSAQPLRTTYWVLSTYSPPPAALRAPYEALGARNCSPTARYPPRPG
jgi:hypothetical protein